MTSVALVSSAAAHRHMFSQRTRTSHADLSGGGSDVPAGDDYEASPSPSDAKAWGRRAAACAGALAAHHARQAPTCKLILHPAVPCTCCHAAGPGRAARVRAVADACAA